jgi:hypothetical protein
LPTAVRAGKAAQTSREIPGKDELLAAGGLDRAGHARVVVGIDRRTVNDFDARQCFDELWDRGTPHAVACCCGNDDWQISAFADRAKATTLCFSSPVE